MLITNRTRGGGARSFVHSSKLLAREEEMLQETRQETDMEIDFNNNPDESIYEEEDSDDYNPVLYKGILGAPALLSIVQFHSTVSSGWHR